MSALAAGSWRVLFRTRDGGVRLAEAANGHVGGGGSGYETTMVVILPTPLWRRVACAQGVCGHRAGLGVGQQGVAHLQERGYVCRVRSRRARAAEVGNLQSRPYGFHTRRPHVRPSTSQFPDRHQRHEYKMFASLSFLLCNYFAAMQLVRSCLLRLLMWLNVLQQWRHWYDLPPKCLCMWRL